MTENKRSKANNEEPTLQPKEEPQQKETHDLFISSEMAEKREAADADVEGDLAEDEIFKTKHREGHTYNPHQAWEQGLTYTPPTDPPTLPSDDEPQGVEIATGFAQNMEGTDPDVERMPSEVDNSDLDLRDDVVLALRNNSETAHLDRIKVQIDGGVVNLLGVVPTEDDIGRVHNIVRELNGVVAVRNNLQTWP